MKIKVKQTYTAYEVIAVEGKKVRTAHGVFELLPKEPKVQRGWYRVTADNSGSVVYMTRGRLHADFTLES